MEVHKKPFIRFLLLGILLLLSLLVLYEKTKPDSSYRDHELSLVSELLAADHEGAVGGIHQLLTVIATAHEYVKDEKDFCSTLLTRESIIFPYFINIGSVDAQGNILCSGVLMPSGTSLANDPAFKEMLTTRDFTVSGSQTSITTGWPSVRFYQPFFDGNGKVAGAYFATFASQWLNGFSPSFSIPNDVTITKFDQYGKVFMRYPNPVQWSGTDQSESELFQTIVKTRQGIVTTGGLDGVTRRYYVRPIILHGKIVSYIIVGN